MKRTALLLALAASAACLGDFDDLWRTTPFYHGASVYTDRKEDRVNLWPLLYHRAPATSVLWPLYSRSDDHLALCPFYSQRRQRGASGPMDEFNVLWPLCQFDFLHGRHRIFPVFWGEGGFAVLPLLVNDPDFLFLPPLWYRKDGSCFAALPFFGWLECDGGNAWWAAAGLAGHFRDRDGSACGWLLPAYWYNHGNFYSLPYSSFDRGGERNDLVCLGLLGHRTLPGGHHGVWAFPLFYASNRELVTPLGGCSDKGDWLLLVYSREGDRFMSLPYARYQSKGCTRQWFGLPFVGTVGGSKEGAYVFPFFDYEEDGGFASLQADLGAGRLPEAGGNRAERKATSLFGLVYGREERIVDGTREEGKGYELKRVERAWSLPLLYNRDATEKVVFDADRRPVGRSVDEASSLMGVLYTSKTRVDTAEHVSRSRSRVLWWLWDREERDGKVAVDVFPGFTYDRHPDGYVKTSFLWRVFRYENDPKDGVSADLFFVPVWR